MSFINPIWKHRSFRHLMLGQAISQIGDAFYYAVFMFVVREMTGKASMVGYVGAIEALPYVLFSAYGGVLADRFDRKRIMMLSDCFSALILVLFALMLFVFGVAPMWLIFLTAFSLSTVRSVFMPAKSAALPRLVEPEELLLANTVSYQLQSYMPFLGLALSATVLGYLYRVFPSSFFMTAVVVNAASFFFSAYFINKLPVIEPERGEIETHPWRDFLDGIAVIRKHATLKTFLAVSLLMNLAISPFFPVYVETNVLWFGGKPQTLSWFEFTFFAGLVIGGYLVGWSKIVRVGLSYIVGCAAIGVTVALMGFTKQFYWFCFWNILAGVAVPFVDIPMTSFIQVSVEDAFRGRVSGALLTMRMAVMPIGMGAGGSLIASLGLVNMYLVMGVGMIVAAAVGMLSRSFRKAQVPSSPAKIINN